MLERRKLGRTQLEVTVMGLGAGGHSRLGQSTGKSTGESIAIVRQALDLGINFIDTAEAYKTEPIVGHAVRESLQAGMDRDAVVLSSKKLIHHSQRRITAAEFQQGLDDSLRRLRMDHVDIYHLHGIDARDYRFCVESLVPEMLRARDQGKIRFLGITEAFASDTTHEMLKLAVEDDCWDVIMVGFNMLNQSARTTILPRAAHRDLGVLDMFAVRRALGSPDSLLHAIGRLIEEGRMDPGTLSGDGWIGFLLGEPGVESIPDAAYRFARDEPGVHVVLSGTGNPDHLRANHAALCRPPLSGSLRGRLIELFGHLDSISGQ
ncbi:MAG: aldo/keto reductase [Phycisphaeraceae bacterium]|nr:aldo/keto reductase [Phycisphaeraceae bacterium]